MKEQRNARVLMLLENSRYPHDPRVSREAKALVAAGYGVCVIAPAETGQRMVETVDGVRVYRYPRILPDSPGVLGYLWEYSYAMAASFALSLVVLAREGFDVIHAANPPDTFALVAAPYKLLGKKFIFDHHDLAPEMYQARSGGQGNPLLHKGLQLMEWISYRLADHVIATNQSYRAKALARGHVPPVKVSIVRNGPTPGRWDGVEPDEYLRSRGRTIVGYLGLMGFQDGVDYLLRAIDHLVHGVGRTDFLCVLVGDGDAVPGLKQQARELGIEEYMHFTGWVHPTEVGRYVKAMDICVAPEPLTPYNDQSTAIKLTEYMSASKPIVAFDLTEHRFTAQSAATYVKPNDEMAFAEAISRLMDSPQERAQLGAFGRSRVESDLAWSYSVPRLLEAYEAVLADGASATVAATPAHAARRGAHK